MKKFGVFIVIVFVFGLAVFFAKTPAVATSEKVTAPVPGTESALNTDGYEPMPIEAEEAASASTGATSRKPAAFVAADQQRIIDEMNKVILAIRSKADVLPAVEKIESLAKQDGDMQMPGVQMYRAVASVVPKFEGIFYRCREFVEPSDWLHMSWLFGLRDFAYNDYLYGPHVKALFDFVTYPSHRVGQPFKSVSELQDFTLGELGPKLQQFSILLTELGKLPAKNFEFQFDRTVLVGQRPGLRFIDPSEAKKLFIKPNLYTIHFLVERAIGTLNYVAAMDLNEMPIVFNRVIRQTTINTFSGDLRLSNPAKGVTPQMTYEIIKKTNSFLDWRKDITIKGKKLPVQQLLDRAFVSGVNSSYYQLAAYVCGIKYPMARAKGQVMEIDIKKDCMSFAQENADIHVANGKSYVFNPNLMTLDFKEKYHELRARTRLYMEAKKNTYSSITSDVTGQTIRVNLKALFNAAHSQRDFMPTEYSSKAASEPAKGLPGVKAWNYDHGKPVSYKDYSFGGFFDPAQVKDTTSLYKTMTTVLYTPAIAPFAIAIRVPSTAQFFIPPSQLVKN